MASTVVIYQLFRVGRVPCKLNNERNEKHQTGARESLWKRALERNWKDLVEPG